MNLHADNSVELAQPPGGAGSKFAYAGGTRPLEGYTIKRGIGRGGFGEVYYAVSDAGKEVALKLIRRNLDVEIRGVTHCLNLKHVNLLAIYDIKRDSLDDAWIVMEYVNGESLEATLERNPNGLSPPDAQRWLRGMLAAVAYLHDHGVVHRDLKPGNIFSDDGIVKIGDYGLSKFISCSRRSGQTESVGTVHYMAPEIANGRYGKEIDIYALGVIVHEMLTGRVPFEGESVGEVLMKHLTAEPDLRRLPEPYRTAVASALVKDPARRVPTVAEFARRMGVVLHSEPLVSPSIDSILPPPILNAKPAPPPLTAFANYPVLDANAPQPPPVAGASAEVPPRVTPPPPPQEEPILRAVKEAWRQLQAAWIGANFGTPAKIAMAVITLVVLMGTAGIWVIATVALGGVYLIYRLIRGFILMNVKSATRQTAARQAFNAAVPPPPPTSKAPEQRQHGRSHRWRSSVAFAPRGSVRERMTELLGSLLLSAVVAAVGSLVLLSLRGESPTPVQFAWLAAVGTLGAWAVLIPCKIWEGPVGEPLLRRLVMFVMGLGVGAAAFAIQQYLQMGPESLLHNPRFGFGQFLLNRVGSDYFDSHGMPGIGCMLYFGFVFMIPKWWSQAEWFRPARLRIWPIFACVLWAWLLHQIWPFTQPWGLLATALISLAVQLSSPWPKVSEERNQAA